jgi:site-specific DNA recombinase
VGQRLWLEMDQRYRFSTLTPRIEQLRLRKENLQATRWDIELQLSARRIELADAATVSAFVADLRQLLQEGSLGERKAFIRSFVREVKVTGDEVLLTYTMPMLPKGVSEEKISVLCIEHGGGW